VDASNGSLIVSELGNHRIQVMRDDGSHLRYIGNGKGDAAGQLDGPRGLALSDTGRLFVCDWNSKRIQSWQVNDGSYIGQFGIDSIPRCVVIGPSKDQLFVSLDSHKIAVIGMDGQLIKSIGRGQGAKDGELNNPTGVAFNSRGELLVGERSNKRVSVFDVKNGVNGEFKRKFGHFVTHTKRSYMSRLHIAVDSFDRVIVSDIPSDRLEFFDSNFQSIGQFGSKGNGMGQFSGLHGVRIDEPNGRLIVCDNWNNRLQIIKVPSLE